MTLLAPIGAANAGAAMTATKIAAPAVGLQLHI
jgi:hypothetical protein